MTLEIQALGCPAYRAEFRWSRLTVFARACPGLLIRGAKRRGDPSLWSGSVRTLEELPRAGIALERCKTGETAGERDLVPPIGRDCFAPPLPGLRSQRQGAWGQEKGAVAGTRGPDLRLYIRSNMVFHTPIPPGRNGHATRGRLGFWMLLDGYTMR